MAIKSKRCAYIAATVLLGAPVGCASIPTLAPAPAIASAEQFAAARSLATSTPTAWPASRWWTIYGDPQLDGLITEGLKGAPDLAAAAARVRQADAIARQAAAARLPTLDLEASAAEARQSSNNGPPRAFVPQGWNETGRVAANFGFDPDLWGVNRAAYAAARSEAAAAALDYAQAELVLSTTIASAYADLAQLFAQRGVQADALDVRVQTERLTADRVAGGLDTQAELKQAQSDVPAARAEIAGTDEQIGLTRNRLAALLGQGPDRGLAITVPALTPALAPALAPAFAIVPRGIPADVTTDLIGRRPDIVAARTRVEAEASRIKAARAAFYPAINLSAMFGFQALGFGNLFKGSSTFGSAGPAISLPIFDGGNLHGRYRGARARFDEAVASYDRTVTDAYRDVADAVTSQRALQVRLAYSQQSLVDAQGASAIARQRYEGGLSTFLDVLTAQDRALRASRTVADLKARAFTLDVALVRALGGGFTTRAASTGKDQNRG